MSANQPQTPERRSPDGVAAGVLDTIADAITLVLQRPWLMIVPIVIDLVLWLILHISALPLVDRMIELLTTSDVEGSDLVIEQMNAAKESVMISDYLGAFVPSLFAGISLDTIMGMLLLFVAPDGFGIPRSDIYGPWRDGLVDVVHPSGAGIVILVWIGALLASSIAMVLYRVPMARVVRGTRPVSLGKELVQGWVHFAVYLLVIAAAIVLSIIPLALISMLTLIMGMSIAFVFSFALLILGTMLGVYTFFAVDAMLIHRVGFRQGFRMSYLVARRYFGQIARFAFVSILVMLATMMLWGELAGSAPGFIVSMFGSAFIGTVLSVASMLFYLDRFRLVRAVEAGTRGSRPNQTS